MESTPSYLARLNDRQKEAVLATDGPVSVLAGAGSGKTSVLTARIYHLIRSGIAPDHILAVTFTNKAAREMRERVLTMLGHEPAASAGNPHATRARFGGGIPLIATFHGLGRELLETYGSAIGVPRHFSIFDRDDSKRAIREALKALDIDPKEIPPASILGRISKAKSDGMSLQEFRDKHGRDSFRARITAEAWIRYDATLTNEKALDFDDLILLPVRLLREHEDVRALVQERFSHLHIDEYQDTNELQGQLAHLIAGDRRNLFVVGDIDQCLVKGTQIAMADGSEKDIAEVGEGELVLSNYGSGDIRPAKVTGVFKNAYSGQLVRITTRTGKVLVSTPEHTHFAGYRLGHTPHLCFTYLMHKTGYGWRLGVSQTYTKGQRAAMIGFQQRCNQEHGDQVWVVGTYATPQEARINEYLLSLAYSIPTIPFVARTSKYVGGYVHSQGVIDDIFRSLDTEVSASRLLDDLGLSREHPHHRTKATRSNRHNIIVTLCGERRDRKAMHRISLVGSDESTRTALKEAGFSVRAAKKDSPHWRFETASVDMESIQNTLTRLRAAVPNAHVIHTARLGGKKRDPKDANSLPYLPAASVRPGMVMFDASGVWEVVEKVESIEDETEVFDLNIEQTHNFIANEITTHNSIYTWRGATIDNLLKFEETYPGCKHIVLEHNYRSTKTIVAAANEIIEKNRNRKEKRSVTDNADGDPITIHAADTAEGEAAWVADQARRAILAGAAPEEVAVLYRTNAQSRALEEAFLHAGLPYRLLGTRFFDRKEVKDMLAWARLAIDPSREADRMRAVQAPTRGIGKVTLGKLLAGKRDELRAADRAKVDVFEAVVAELSAAAEQLTPSTFVKLVLEKSGLEASLRKEGEEGQERLENVRELGALASRHDDTPGKDGIARWLAEAALASDQDEMDRGADGKRKAVTLMTVHAAKGLEFDQVFVTGMEEGLFPHSGMEGDDDRDEEEERRLFYVAVTRARKRLILTLARVRRIYGTDYFSEPSQFLHDIDSSLVRTTYEDFEPEEVIHI